mmetsp:Transcript_31746/g.101871  ORF Transcript_31746/g.101871 Transcript_31746/m.101871 type:complete len:200 (+) Transcript_31746:303-902(+)
MASLSAGGPIESLILSGMWLGSQMLFEMSSSMAAFHSGFFSRIEAIVSVSISMASVFISSSVEMVSAWIFLQRDSISVYAALSPFGPSITFVISDVHSAISFSFSAAISASCSASAARASALNFSMNSPIPIDVYRSVHMSQSIDSTLVSWMPLASSLMRDAIVIMILRCSGSCDPKISPTLLTLMEPVSASAWIWATV